MVIELKTAPSLDSINQHTKYQKCQNRLRVVLPKFVIDQEEKYRTGKFGSTDGKFGDKHYFACEDGCGLFLSLRSLSPSYKYQSTRCAPDSSHSAAIPSQCSLSNPSAVTHSFQFSIGDKVSFCDIKGVKHYGTVQWNGRSSALRTFDYNIVGIYTVCYPCM